MKSKVYLFETLGLFFIGLCSILYSYAGKYLPDHQYLISSENESINWISYGLSSMISFLGFYTGPFIIGIFIIFVLVHSFLLKERNFVPDYFFLPALLIFSAGMTYILSPAFIGDGLYFLLKNILDPSIILIAILSSGFFCTYIVLKDHFHAIKSLVLKTKDLFVKVLPLLKLKKIKVSKSALLSKENLSSIKEKFNKTPDEVVYHEQKEEEIKENENALAVVSDSHEVVVSEALEASPTEQDVLPKSRPKRPKRNLPQDEIKSSDLINCITQAKVKQTRSPDEKYFDEIIERLEEKMTEFKINAKIINILKGPVVDTFELELGAGVKVSRVANITEDLSLALLGAPIRMIYPMKGKTTVGIEVPRNPREIIYLDEILKSKEFRDSKYRIPLAMGRDAFGEVFVVDLAAMPHMLVAGATGAGKSVFINTLLASLLVKLPPSKLKLILIDPKQLELALYSELPHLIVPVVTDAKTAALSLMWATQEMERRYSILKQFGVRNIEGFNEKLKTIGEDKIEKIRKYFDYDTDDFELPYVVVIIDEFADLILTKSGKEIELNICRLAAKARAAGIHLVLATQRPSVDVITGLIKSNFPTRVSFRVTSSIDSRTILNSLGAEKLLGKGDMLYKHGIDMNRLHSAFVDENEIEALTEKLSTIPSEFDPNAQEFIENGGHLDDGGPGGVFTLDGGNDDEKDPLYDEAVKVVLEHRSASASMLQRRLKVGYNRAANLVEMLEAKGIVGPQQGSKPRKVLVSAEDTL